MENINMLFEQNTIANHNVRLNKGKIVYKPEKNVINGDEIYNIINFVNALYKKYKKVKVPVVFDVGRIKFEDKLTYIIMECIFYYMIIIKKHNIHLYFGNTNIGITTNGILSSPLNLINAHSSKKTFESFSKKFHIDIYGQHYRKIIKGNIDLNSNELGKIMSDIDMFLTHFNVSSECSDEISRTAIELVGNAIEHTRTDCLIDIDIANDYMKVGCENEEFYGVNIVVLNFSNNLIGDSLKQKINEISINDLSKIKEIDVRYQKVKEAHGVHQKWFDKLYTEDDFYNIASFQDRISGSNIKKISGGKGLTQLINSLAERSDFHSCYMLSGHNVLRFQKDYINLNNERWVGFNKENDFINNIPDMSNISYSRVFFPGTAYNLNFVIKKEVIK